MIIMIFLAIHPPLLLLQVKDVEDQINRRKAEVEKLIQEMREVNMESLAISPLEESKQFLDGKYLSKHFHCTNFMMHFLDFTHAAYVNCCIGNIQTQNVKFMHSLA